MDKSNTSMDVSVILFYNVNRGWLKYAVKSYEKQIFSAQSEIVIIHKDQPTAKNANEGLRQAKGKYIKFLHEDDQLLPTCLQTLYDKAAEGFDVVCANAIQINPERETQIVKSRLSPTVSHMAQDYGIHGGTVLYRRAMLEVVGGIDESLEFAEEFDLHLRLAMAGYKFGYVDREVYLYRLHDNQKSMQGGYRDGEKYVYRKRYILHNVVEKYQGNHQLINI